MGQTTQASLVNNVNTPPYYFACVSSCLWKATNLTLHLATEVQPPLIAKPGILKTGYSQVPAALLKSSYYYSPVHFQCQHLHEDLLETSVSKQVRHRGCRNPLYCQLHLIQLLWFMVCTIVYRLQGGYVSDAHLGCTSVNLNTTKLF